MTLFAGATVCFHLLLLPLLLLLLPELLLLLVLVLLLLSHICSSGGALRASHWSWRCARRASSARNAQSKHDASRPIGVCCTRGAIRKQSRALRAGGARRLFCGSNASRVRRAPWPLNCWPGRLRQQC